MSSTPAPTFLTTRKNSVITLTESKQTVVFTFGIREKMKKILHTLLISCFSFSIISCASMGTSTMLLVAGGGGAAYWYKDEIIDVYDDLYADFTKEEVKTGKKKHRLKKQKLVLVI